MDYLTLREEAIAEIDVKHSKFIAFACHVDSADDADEYVRAIKKRYADATHAPYGYVVGEKGETFRASDDGEPSGTSGVPILEVIKKSGLTFCAVIVVRYFGGIKLGTGGLAHAYSDSALEAIKKAKKVTYTKCKIVQVECDYSAISSVQNKVYAFGGAVESSLFDNGAQITVAVPSENYKDFFSAIADVTKGKGKISEQNERFYALK